MPHTDPCCSSETPATSTAWPLLAAALAALQCRKGLRGQLPELLLSPYDFQAVNMASFGAPGWLCSARPCQAGWGRPQHTKGPSLGWLSLELLWFQSGNWDWERLIKMCIGVADIVYFQRKRCTFTVWNTFDTFRAPTWVLLKNNPSVYANLLLDYLV